MTRTLEICDGPLAHERDFAKSLYHFLPRHHGHSGQEFLTQLLAADYGMVMTAYREFQASFRANYPDRIDSHIDAVACVATADYLASAWVFGEPWEQARAGAESTAQHIISGLISTKEASESERAWEAFVDWLAENQDRFSAKFAGPRYDYQENSNLFVIRNIVNRFLDENYSGSRRIIREWGESGKIETFYHGGKTRFDMAGRVEGAIRPRVIKISGAAKLM